MSHFGPDYTLCEPFALGARLKTRTRYVGEADFQAIIGASWENTPHHTDEEAMRRSRFGGRILGGPCLIAIAGGLTAECIERSWELGGVAMIAGLSLEARYRSPLLVGDSIHVESVVSEMRPRRQKEGELVATVDDRVINQRGELVVEMKRAFLLEPAPEPANRS